MVYYYIVRVGPLGNTSNVWWKTSGIRRIRGLRGCSFLHLGWLSRGSSTGSRFGNIGRGTEILFRNRKGEKAWGPG